MSQSIESMESRILFAATAMVINQDLAALKTQEAAAKADLTAALSTASADTKTVKADVVATHPTASQKTVLNVYIKDEATAASKYKAMVSTILSAGARDANMLHSTASSLEAHPTSTAIQAKVRADLAALQGVFSSTVVSALEAQARTTVAGLDLDLNAIASSFPTTQTDVSATENHFATDLTTLSTQASAIQADLSALASDLA